MAYAYHAFCNLGQSGLCERDDGDFVRGTVVTTMATPDVHVQVSGSVSMTLLQRIPTFAVKVDEDGYDYATFTLLVLKENRI